MPTGVGYSFVDVNAEVSAVPPPIDPEILADFLETDNISDDELVDDSDDVKDVLPWEK